MVLRWGYVAAAVLAVGCATGQAPRGGLPPSSATRLSEPVTAADLRLPADAYPGVVEVVTRALAVDDGAPEDSAAPEVLVLRRSGQTSAANYRYHLSGDGSPQLKVRIDVFADGAAAAAAFRGRHLPEALALMEPFAVGDEGYRYGEEWAGFRLGPVVVELRATVPGHLVPFARRYAQLVGERLAAGGT